MRPVPGLTIAEQPESVLLPMVLWGEARGESNFTKLCILWVIKNRTARRHTTMKEEILRPKQFSSFNHDDPNLPKLLIGYKLEPGPWSACEAVCDVLPFTTDPTGGATHYYVFQGPGAVAPVWGRGHGDWVERLVANNMVFGATA